MPSSTISIVTGYIGQVFSDALPLVLLVAGISIAIWIVTALIDAFVKRRDKED